MTYDPTKTMPREDMGGDEAYWRDEDSEPLTASAPSPSPRQIGALDEGDGLPPEMWLQRLTGEIEQLLREAQERHTMYEKREADVKKELAQVRQHKARTEGEIEMLFNMRALNEDQQQFLIRRTK